MKGIKKFFNILLLILLCFFAGCANPIVPEPEVPDEGISIQVALEEATIELSENDTISSVTSNLIFIEKYEDLEYQWLSSDESVISSTGIVTRPKEDTEVTITLKINDGIDTVEKQFVFIVLKEEIVFDGYTYDLKNVKSLLTIYDLNEVEEDGEYNNYLDLVAYIHLYHKLPKNYLTKSQAKSLGWSGSGSNVWQNSSLQGKYIGGDTFKNYEGYLPIIDNNTYIELDVNCDKGKRGAHRIVYNRKNFDIYYTDDHYYTFTYMIGEVQ